MKPILKPILTIPGYRKIHDAILSFGDSGITKKEIMRVTGADEFQVRMKLRELMRQRCIAELPEPTKCPQRKGGYSGMLFVSRIAEAA